MTQIDSGQNETDIYANETQGKSSQDNDDTNVYSQVEERKPGWNERQSDRVTTDKTKAATEAHTGGPGVSAEVNKPSKAPETSSALKSDRVGRSGLVYKDDCLPDHTYSLASDIYANETADDSSTQLVAGVVSKAPLPQEDDGQTVIENDLYCH